MPKEMRLPDNTDQIFYFFIFIVLASILGSGIVDVINNAGLTGIIGALPMIALPAGLLIYVLRQLANQ